MELGDLMQSSKPAFHDSMKRIIYIVWKEDADPRVFNICSSHRHFQSSVAVKGFKSWNPSYWKIFVRIFLGTQVRKELTGYTFYTSFLYAVAETFVVSLFVNAVCLIGFLPDCVNCVCYCGWGKTTVNPPSANRLIWLTAVVWGRALIYNPGCHGNMRQYWKCRHTISVLKMRPIFVPQSKASFRAV